MIQTHHSFIIQTNNCLFYWNKFFVWRFLFYSNKFFIFYYFFELKFYLLRSREKGIYTEKNITRVKEIQYWIRPIKYFLDQKNFFLKQKWFFYLKCTIFWSKENFFGAKTYLEGCIQFYTSFIQVIFFFCVKYIKYKYVFIKKYFDSRLHWIICIALEFRMIYRNRNFCLNQINNFCPSRT